MKSSDSVAGSFSNSARVVWLTGVSGVGKTTLASKLADRFSALGRAVEVLDGDELRRTISFGAGFERSDREQHIMRIGYVAALLRRNGIMTVVAAIAPDREVRERVRSINGPHYIEVYLTCPLTVLVERDTKGLYRRALKGELKHFAGVNMPYEASLVPDLTIDTSITSVEDSATLVLDCVCKTQF